MSRALFALAAHGVLALLVACSSAPAPTEVVYILPSEERALGSAGAVSATKPDADPTYPAQSPEQALASFLRAYENQRYDVILRFTPNADLGGEHGLDERTLRQAWEGPLREEIEQKVAMLRAALAGKAPIERVGEEQALMAYGPGRAISFVLEDGVWKIRDF